MDKLLIEALKVETLIGVHPWEQQLKQTVLLDIELDIDVSEAAAQDQLEATVDYAAVAEGLSQYISDNQCQLLETLAERSAAWLLEHTRASAVQLKVMKPGAVPQAKVVGLLINRTSSAV